MHTVNTSPIEHRVSSKYSCLLMSSTLVVLCIDEKKWIKHGDENFASRLPPLGNLSPGG